MTLVDWIILGAVAAAVLAVVVVVARRWNQLRRLDLEAMPRAKLRSKKYQLIEDRLSRKTQGLRTAARKAFQPAGSKLGGGFQKLHGKLVALEKKYRHAGPAAQTQEAKEITRQKVTGMMEEGAQLFKEEKYTEAEEIFLDIVRINPKEVEAYEYLGEVYLGKKEYDHAIETLEFAKKLNPNDDRIYYDLAQAHLAAGDKPQALELLRKSVELAPKNPRNLHAVIELAVELNDRFVAKETLRKFKDANPENASLADLEKIVREM
jgi:tetratricopeptide (TPR) repeat protein